MVSHLHFWRVLILQRSKKTSSLIIDFAGAIYLRNQYIYVTILQLQWIGQSIVVWHCFCEIEVCQYGPLVNIEYANKNNKVLIK